MDLLDKVHARRSADYPKVPHWTPGTDPAEYNALTRQVGTMRATILAQEATIRQLQQKIERLEDNAGFVNQREW
jgi:predicted  nucleic acid-binding Zn-ribbon protein